MAEQQNDPSVMGLKTLLKGKDGQADQSGQSNSVKDQVKQALLKNRGAQASAATPNAGQAPAPSGAGGGADIKAQLAAKMAQGSAGNANSSANSPTNNPSQGGAPNPGASNVLSKLGKTVDSINEVHSTMESLNKNMNLFVDLFKQRGNTLSSGGGAGVPSGTGSGSTASGGMSADAASMGFGGNAVTSLLLTNLLKKKDDETGEKLEDYNKGSQEYLDLLMKKLDKFQTEYELLQYLFQPKLFGQNMSPTEDANGNSTWLMGFMQMMMNKKR